MDWNKIISNKRTGKSSNETSDRTNFQRDFDRIVFSSAFRRLQNKTQVFPLPKAVFVHNRLTHSLEVASVGRSLGKSVGKLLCEKGFIQEENRLFYKEELQNVVASACLAHDIGNPPFGHSGESAISEYFVQNKNFEIQNKKLKDFFSEKEWEDLANFEGNANTFRVLVNKFHGKGYGSFMLTYTTLASLVKYPWAIQEALNRKTKKFGFFMTEEKIIQNIFNELSIQKVSEDPLSYTRHPFVYLTEAADDICYGIVDFEDAHRLGIVDFNTVSELFLSILKETEENNQELNKIKYNLNKIKDNNEQISYLRAKIINVLTKKAAEVFIKNQKNIISGQYLENSQKLVSLLDILRKEYPSLKELYDQSKKNIYNYKTVVQIEIAGYNVMSELLSLFVPAVLKSSKSLKDKKLLKLIPDQFLPSTFEKTSNYEKVISVLDFFSGMTDDYIVDFYRKIFGIEIPEHR